MVDMVAIISECDVIGGEVGDVCVGEVGGVRRLRRVRVRVRGRRRRRRRRGGVVEGLGSGGTGSFFQTKVFGGGGSIAMLANGGHALSSCPSGLTV